MHAGAARRPAWRAGSARAQVRSRPACATRRFRLRGHLSEAMGPDPVTRAASHALRCPSSMTRAVLLSCLALGVQAQSPHESCAGWPLPNGYGATSSAMGAPPPPPGSGPARDWASVGNHRFELHVDAMPVDGTAVHARLPWARHDAIPNATAIVVLSSATSLAVPFCTRISATSEEGEIVFSASDGPGLYHAYYMPFVTCEYGACEYGASANYDRTAQPRSCNDTSAWINAPPTNATIGDLQSRTAFDAWTEMELAATAAQTDALLQHAAADGVLLVVEDRTRPVRMVRHLPQLWHARLKAHGGDSLATFRGNARPGEAYTFQVALYASRQNITISHVVYSSELQALSPSCMNLEGSDYWGRPYIPSEVARTVPQGEVRSFYIAGTIPNSTSGPHTIEGTVTLVGVDGVQYSATASIAVSGGLIDNGGDDEIWRNTRVQWLNSQIGLIGSTLPPPFTPIDFGMGSSARTISLLGKSVTVGADGLLARVDVASDPNSPEKPTTALAAPVRFDILVGGKPIKMSIDIPAKLSSDAHRRSVSWESKWTQASSGSGALSAQVSASLDFSGYADYVVAVNASGLPANIGVELVIPMAVENTHFALGLSRPGGLLSTWFTNKSGCCCGTPRCDSTCTLDPTRSCPQRDSPQDCCPTDHQHDPETTTHWKWDGVNGDNALWLGSSKAGIRLFPKGDEDLWQAGVPFDGRSTPPDPPSWSNNGTGGIRVHSNGTCVAYTGHRAMPASGSLVFRFSLMVTPTRPLNLTKHWGERYFQAGGPVDYHAVAEGGATVLNMHQGNVINPWINYPYATNQLMAEAADACHQFGMRFKIYNTMRELSNRCREIWAMRSFHETYVEGPVVQEDAADWLQEHLGGNFQKAWSNPMLTPYDKSADLWWSQQQDAAIKVKALSRWNNYYVEGTRQMQRDFNYDGIYLDEIAYDRVTIMRTKAVLGDQKLIDHHCDIGDMGGNSCAANYMEMYPFIDTLWYGEGFNYDHASADYWLTEISGLALGLPSDMLRYAGMTPMHVKGLAHGSTNRWQAISHAAGCAKNISTSCDPFDPRDIWALQSSFGISESVMIGWWVELEEGREHLPVTTNMEDVKVTTYLRKGHSALIVLANFGNAPLSVTLSFNWALLGLKSATAHLHAPALRVPPQKARRWGAELDGMSLVVPAATMGDPSSLEGMILLLEANE